ncbi:hypothetical protein ACFL24_01625 [Patescibacteria group bacterium]
MGKNNKRKSDDGNGKGKKPPAWSQCPVRETCTKDCYQCSATCNFNRNGKGCINPGSNSHSGCKHEDKLGKTYYKSQETLEILN